MLGSLRWVGPDRISLSTKDLYLWQHTRTENEVWAHGSWGELRSYTNPASPTNRGLVQEKLDRKKKKKHQEKGEEPKKAGQLPVPGPGQAAKASDYLLQP